MSFNYRVAGYVKLAKLWEKNRKQLLAIIRDIIKKNAIRFRDGYYRVYM